MISRVFNVAVTHATWNRSKVLVKAGKRQASGVTLETKLGWVPTHSVCYANCQCNRRPVQTGGKCSSSSVVRDSGQVCFFFPHIKKKGSLGDHNFSYVCGSWFLLSWEFKKSEYLDASDLYLPIHSQMCLWISMLGSSFHVRYSKILCCPRSATMANCLMTCVGWEDPFNQHWAILNVSVSKLWKC